MWYILPTEKWIVDVVALMNEKQLKPENSKFMIAFFSSMDNEFVNYFKSNKEQISAFSGSNFHIFTPLIYEGNTIPDDQWRYMRNEFKRMGVPIANDPTFIFFNLDDNTSQKGNDYYPRFFAGFKCASFLDFPNKLKKAIDTSIETNDICFLTDKLSEIFSSPNIIDHSHFNEFENTIARNLPNSRLFISYSHQDKTFVKKLVNELSKDDSIKLWIDEKELFVGDDIQESITNELRSSSDFLLIIISENSTKSKWVQFEVSQFIGFTDGRNIIPIVVSNGYTFPEPINNVLARKKYLDFTDDINWNDNLNELKKIFSRK